MYRRWIGAGLAGLVIAGMTLVWLLAAQPTAAQCGSSVSSCKNCHEVQAQFPVNNQGEWHTAHAFGDFCEFCHAGNVQAQDVTTAHQGLVDPLSDVKAGCQSCHPDDYTGRAQKYAVALGVELGAGGGSSAPPSGRGESPSPEQPPVASSDQASSVSAADSSVAVVAPSGGEVIDFNQVYLESVETADSPAMNRGDALLATLIVLMMLVFAGLVWHFEKVPARLAAWWQANVVTVPQAVGVSATGGAISLTDGPSTDDGAPSGITDWPSVLANRPELADVLAELATADRATLEATTRLLRSRPLGPRVMKAVAKLDLDLLAAVTRLDTPEMELLMAVRKEL